MNEGNVGRRVTDVVSGGEGTVVAYIGQRRGKTLYRVNWDSPTPHQDTAEMPIPSQWCTWVEGR